MSTSHAPQVALPSPTFATPTNWRALYQAALFETDREKLPHRISEAEKAVLHRMKELFHESGDHIEEDLILDDALYALRALRTCTAHKTMAA